MCDIEEKKPKLELEAPPPENCAHWLHRKKRFCKMTVSKGRKYCGEHEPAVEQTDEVGNVSDAAERVRIPCPLDDKHTVYRRNLQKHLKICNARQKANEPDYIEKGINAGETDDVQDMTEDIKLNELEDDEFYEVVTKIKNVFEKYVEGQIETLQVRHKSLDEELAKAEFGKDSKKHLLQTSALLGILEREKQLQDSTSYIEFGAGKGQLAFYLAQLLEQLNNSQVLLLDRASLRHKKDNKIENKSLVHRIRVDIADFRINRLELLRHTQRNVAISKHLCGAATDLTLRCITQPNSKPLTTETMSTTESESPASTEFIMIALCCHHRCEWRSFVGKIFFQTHAITPRQFIIITKMVSWGICGTGMSRERRRALEQQSLTPQQIHEINSKQRLSLDERKRIGFMCKRVLDYARLVYLREHGYEASLKNYVSRDVTLENVCLLAKKLK